MSINQKTRLRPELDPLKQLGNIVLLERPLNAETLASAADALAMMRENPTGLRKCDIGMPYMNCFDLIRQVRQLYGRQARASGPSSAATASTPARTRSSWTGQASWSITHRA